MSIHYNNIAYSSKNTTNAKNVKNARRINYGNDCGLYGICYGSAARF